MTDLLAPWALPGAAILGFITSIIGTVVLLVQRLGASQKSIKKLNTVTTLLDKNAVWTGNITRKMSSLLTELRSLEPSSIDRERVLEILLRVRALQEENRASQEATVRLAKQALAVGADPASVARLIETTNEAVESSQQLSLAIDNLEAALKRPKHPAPT